jgi:hypothetical protein
MHGIGGYPLVLSRGQHLSQDNPNPQKANKKEHKISSSP